MKEQRLPNKRFLLFVIAVLFSLTPCKVKVSLFETFGATYEQTLNQSKVTSSCSSSNFINQKGFNSKVFFEKLPVTFISHNCFEFERKSIRIEHFAKSVSLQLPPKYILYKQFKFDLV